MNDCAFGGMKKGLLLVVFLSCSFNIASAQYFDKLVERYGVEKKADVVEISNKMMKVARFFVTGKEKGLFKMIDNMSILSLKDCSTVVQETFLKEIIAAEPPGYEMALHTDKKGNISKVFVKKSGEENIAYEMVVSSAENKGDVVLMIMNGRFVLSEVTEIFK